MALRNQQTLEVTDILIRDKTDGNVLASGPEGGALENFNIDQGKLVRLGYMPPFHTSSSDDPVWAIKEFNFTRDNAPEQQLLIFKENGRVYRRAGGMEHIIYPPNDVSAATATPDDGYAGTGATVAGSGTDWSNAANITGASNSSYATSAATGGSSTNTGVTAPGTVADLADSGETWSNITNVITNDGSVASNSFAAPNVTSTLRCSNFGFAIPGVATIDGIKVEVEWQAGSGDIYDTSVIVRSITAGVVSDNLATGALFPSSLGTFRTYGGSTDLLGTTWTAANINATDFAVDVQAKSDDVAPRVVNIDTIRITIYYTTPSDQSTDVLKATNYGLSVAGVVAGITVKITGHVTASSGSTDSTVTAQLISSSGSIVGTSSTKPISSTSDVTLTFGGSTNLWGASWTSSDVNNTNFGVQFYCSKTASPAGIVTYSIDSVQILVDVQTSADVAASLFTTKPVIAQVANRLHVSDGRLRKIYDGWNWFDAGLAAPTGFDSSDTSLTGTGLTGTYDIAVTAVHLRSNNGVDVRVHESNRSGLATESPSNQGIAVDISGVTFPDRATHWSVYMETPAGSGVLRRVTTLPLTTTTYTITAEPASTAATAPERNDPVQPSKILCQWNNRIAARSETNPDKLVFTAFGEVNGLLNGAGEECTPGSLGTDSLSDIVNEWTVPDGGQPIQCAVFHAENLWVFTDRSGFQIVGTGALLDNNAPRDFYPQRLTSFGAAGPTAACSTPFGLAVMSHEHKLWFRRNDGAVFDIGHDIQSSLDDLTESELNNIEMVYWTGEGWDLLLIPLQDRIGVFDLGMPSEQSPVGIWRSIGSQNALPQPTSLAIYHPNKKFLLSGHVDGSVHQLLALCQPAHLGLSCTLGETYFGSSVQDSPISIARTGPLSGKNGSWSEWKNIQFYHRGHTDTDNISTTNPTVTAYYDPINPAEPSSGIALTVNSVNGSNERRAWCAPSSTSSAAGALARKVLVELKYDTTDTDGASREQLVNNEILSLSVTSQPKSTLSR